MKSYIKEESTFFTDLIPKQIQESKHIVEENIKEEDGRKDHKMEDEYKEMYSKITEEKIKKVVREYFSFENVKPQQLECLQALKQFKHVLNIMPTGGGKSLVYQILPLLVDGISIVISPLLSLIQDQIQSLQSKNIIAESINSSCNKVKKNDMFELLRNDTQNNIQILFLTPETATSDYFAPLLKELYNKRKICLFAIDEAHCISTWGCDFRKTYRNLKKILELCPLVRVYACTATANKNVEKDIIANLHLNTEASYSKMSVIRASFNRPNLKYVMIYSDLIKKPKSEIVLDIIEEKKNKGKSGIVYCFKRNVCEEITKDLRKRGVQAMSYHAGLSVNLRKTTQEKWIQGKVQILVATVAFGMGIDRANVSFIIHYNLPKSITNYYQESGRAGRDGTISFCYVIYTMEDVQSMSFIIKKSYSSKDYMDEEKQKRYEHEINNLEDAHNLCMNDRCIRSQILKHFNEDYQPLQNVAKLHKENEKNDAEYCCSFCFDRSGSRDKIEKVMNLYNNKNCTPNITNYYEEGNKKIVEQMNNFNQYKNKKRNYNSYEEEGDDNDSDNEREIYYGRKNKKMKGNVPVFTPSSLISNEIRKEGIHKVMKELETKEQLFQQNEIENKHQNVRSRILSNFTKLKEEKQFRHTAFKIPRKLEDF